MGPCTGAVQKWVGNTKAELATHLNSVDPINNCKSEGTHGSGAQNPIRCTKIRSDPVYRGRAEVRNHNAKVNQWWTTVKKMVLDLEQSSWRC